MTKPLVRIRPEFLAKLENTGLTDRAAAAAIGVTKQYFSQVKNGQTGPSMAFLAGAVDAGLADSFDEVARLVKADAKQAA